MSDRRARERILNDLDTNFLVEAGAGSGKTTALVGRLLTHVRRGTTVESLAAVTFTRKAANELREKFQLGLEAALALPAPPEERDRLTAALADLDRAFVGTIHAFCGRLLREHALEAGLDPAFTEEDEHGWPILVEAFWTRWLDECRLAQDPDFLRLIQLGLDPDSLLGAFARVVGHPDATFPAPPREEPDTRASRNMLESLLDDAESLLPGEEPEGGWDRLQKTVRQLRYRRHAIGWEDTASFCEALTLLTKASCKVTQKSWSDDKAGKLRARQLGEEFLAYIEGAAARLLQSWREYRYGPVIGFLQRGAREFAGWRRRTGHLGFEDLLERCAHLLRSSAPARTALGLRYRHLLVDEFQDTDPIQAEVCFLLASDAAAGLDWRQVTPRPGALFVVGDPKQSIYRFRRADIQTYDMVKRQIAARGGEVLTLTRNFRSTTAIAEVVNSHFGAVFPETATDVQAAFSPLESQTVVPAGQGISRLCTCAPRNAPAIQAESAAQIAAWIATRVHAAGGDSPGDFMVLTWHRAGIDAIARALSERNVPVQTAGAPIPQETELRELITLLRALAAPDDPVKVVAALEGLFFGLVPAELVAALDQGIACRLSAPPAGTGKVTSALATLHRWWLDARVLAPDVLLSRLLDETGLLPWAASQALGEARAGALLRLGDELRAGSADGVHDLASAVTRLEALLERRDTEDAPLRPGRGDAVQVMNLHKAKGLEAKVVILAAPTKPAVHAPTFHVTRNGDGYAEAWMVIEDGDRETVAQPPGWAMHAAAEARFLAAERDRLLYVAVTRARTELIVGQYGGTAAPADPGEDDSAWSPLRGAIAGAPELLVPATIAEGRRTFEDPASITTARSAAEAWRRQAASAAWRRTIVTESARAEKDDERHYAAASPVEERSNRAWGRAVHRIIEALGRGRRDARLTAFITAVVRDEQLPADRAAVLERIATEVLASDSWRALADGRTARFEFPIARAIRGEAGLEVQEGVIDAASLDGPAWRVVDWKTGGAGVTTAPEYLRQVGAYADMLSALTNAPATGAIVRVSAPPPAT